MATKTLKHAEVYKTFCDWYKEFIDKSDSTGGEYDYVAKKGWFDSVQIAQESLRGFLGGVRSVQEIETNNNQGKADLKLTQSLLHEIKDLVPSVDKLEGGLGSLLNPTVKPGKCSLRTGKWLNTEAKKIHNASSPAMKQLSKLISKLGQYWDQAKCKSGKFSVIMTTSAKGFALLGHYGPDSISCFRQGSDNVDNKYILGQTPNTFVVVIKEEGKKGYLARLWGFTNEDHTVFNFSNLYKNEDNSLNDGTILKALKIFVANLLKKDPGEINLFEKLVKVNNDGVYFNGGSNWSLSSKEKVDKQVLEPIKENVREIFKCPGCNEEYEFQDEWEEIDGKLSCEYCLDKASYLESDGTYTKEKVHWSYDANSQGKDRRESELKKLNYHLCNHCEEYYHPKICKEIKKDIYCCNDCLQDNYKKDKNKKYGYVLV